MTQDNDKKPSSLGLSPAQVVGSALAAMSVAFFASWAGTAGTLIGAAVGSVIATVGAATYTWSLKRTSAAARRTAAIVKQRGLVTGTLPRTIAQGPRRKGDNADAVSPEEARTRTDGEPATAPDETENENEKSSWWQLPWARLALASLAVMIVGMAGITAVEAVTGKPIASLFGHDSGGRTTLTHVLGGDSTTSTKNEKTKDTPAPQPSESSQPSEPSQEPAPSQSPVPSTAPSQSPAVPVPSQAPSATP
jgi:hypothetical protein